MSRKRPVHRRNRGDLTPVDVDEAVLFGGLTPKLADEYIEKVIHFFAFIKQWKCSANLAVMSNNRAQCVGVFIDIDHPHWLKQLRFQLPPMKWEDACVLVSKSITHAQSRPNVDPAAYVRESLRYAPASKPQ